MKEFKSSITINASPEQIWAILMNTPAYPEWDSSCEKVEGRVALGAKIKAYSKLSPGRAFPLKVTELVPNQKMTWTGGMPLGLFRGVRTFTLTPRSEQSTAFTLHEVFSGPFLKVIGGSIPDMTEAFQQFTSGLKNRAEGKS